MVFHKIFMFTMHRCHFKDFLLRNMVKILSKLVKKMNKFFWSITFTHDLNPLMKVQLSVVVGCFFRTYEECSRFFSMGIYGVKHELLATEMKNCNDKEFVKFSTCDELISSALICFIAGMPLFGLLQNQSVGVHWFNYWKKFVRNEVKTSQIWKNKRYDLLKKIILLLIKSYHLAVFWHILH